MTQRKLHSFIIGVLSLLVAGAFVCFPVYASAETRISIVEKVADGSGGYKPWEDITGAMPGERYSLVPRVKNDGSEGVEVEMCLSESMMDASGAMAELPTRVFEIGINEHWVLDNEAEALDLGLANCYKYDLAVEAGEVTEPIFTEVVLSSKLGNTYKNSVFNLHLQAFVVGEMPDEPDTGAFTMREPFSGAGEALGLLSAIAVTVLVVHFVMALRRRNRKNCRKC